MIKTFIIKMKLCLKEEQVHAFKHASHHTLSV